MRLSRIVRARSMRSPWGSGAVRRVSTGFWTRVMRATIRRARASSSALICSKSRRRRTSAAEKPSRSSSSAAGAGAGPAGDGESGGRQASATRRETVGERGIRGCGRSRASVRGAQRVAPEQAEGLLEDVEVLGPLDQDRVERPVELLAMEHVYGRGGGQGVERARRPQTEAGAAQQAGEVEDVLGELRAHGTAGSPARASRTNSSTGAPAVFSTSSWYLRSTPEGGVRRSRRRARSGRAPAGHAPSRGSRRRPAA